MARRSKPKSQTTPPSKTAATARSTSVGPTSKTHRVIGLLQNKRGATISELAAATGWQAHSVRGFLSATVRKKLGLELRSEKRAGEARRYHVEG
ncbi:MAG: DUF3489 domain-containing protein [Hyphomicrobium sp.]